AQMAKSYKMTNHPWVMIAAICEHLLLDKDNVFSAIRLVDTFPVRKPPDWDGKTSLVLPMTVFLGFKSGDVKGSRTIKLYQTDTEGKRKIILEREIEFLGGGAGVNIRLILDFEYKTEGLHWIDVYVEKWLATCSVENLVRRLVQHKIVSEDEQHELPALRRI